jgi:60 kDa SS-A/Ro ribonucleoprotein
MANKSLFASVSSSVVAPAVETKNNAGGDAYFFTNKQMLAQIAATNCFNNTYYSSSEENLELAKKAVLNLKNDPEFVAKTAIYCRDKAYMKDMPAFLLVALITWGETKLFRKVFDIVIDNGKMLRNFVQIGRSGVLGKKINMSSGAVRSAINNWFKNKNSNYIFRASIGNDPSMKDILKMARPKPDTPEKAALFAYLLGNEFDQKTNSFITKKKGGEVLYSNSYDNLPDIVKNYENFKKTHDGEIPNVDFRMLDSVLTKEELAKLWSKQAEIASWTTTRMNLNNFAKYDVFSNKTLTNKIVERLSNKDNVINSRCYPYQLLTAYLNTDSAPAVVREALQDAMEHSLINIPEIKGGVDICVDTSGSMSSAITGSRGTATSKVTCVQVASLFASALLRKNKLATVVPFDTVVHKCDLNPRDSVMSNATKLASYGGGGTDISSAVRHLNNHKSTSNTLIIISDNESWYQLANLYGSSRGTGLMQEWSIFKKRNKDAKLIVIDLIPRNNSQVNEDKSILQIGGFGDQVFDVISSFVENSDSKNHWVDIISKVSLDDKSKNDNLSTEELT